MDFQRPITVVGAGLAGSECAYQLAQMGHLVHLYEMRGDSMTPAHKTAQFAELVCSNSFGSQTDYSAPGQLKWEAAALGSLILQVAKQTHLPAGMALGVDRELFAKAITETLEKHPRIVIHRERIDDLQAIPRPAVVATGPLTSDALAESLRAHFDHEFLYFFDAIAPIVSADSIDTSIAWKGDRFDKGTKDYYNCPLDRDQYFALVNEIKTARKIEPKHFEITPYFQGCMPIEAIAERGDLTLRFGPMSPKGLRHPTSGQRPFAVVQLRQDNRDGTAFNMVGFQTRMAYGEQTRVFRTIPGLQNAEFLKLGSIHRNLYIQSPKKLTPFLSSRKDPELYFAGQITGVEGYFESTCMGLLVAHFIHDAEQGRSIQTPPRASALGSLMNALTEDNDDFQPTNINFGLLPPIPDFIPYNRREKEHKRTWQLLLAQRALRDWIITHKPWLPAPEITTAEPYVVPDPAPTKKSEVLLDSH